MLRAALLMGLSLAVLGCEGFRRSSLPLEGIDETVRYGSEAGAGGSGPGRGSEPYVRIEPVRSPQRGGAELGVAFEVRDADGIAIINASLALNGEVGAAEKLEVDATSTVFALPLLDVVPAWVRLRVVDNEGNVSVVDSADFVIDATPPVLTLAPIASPQPGGGLLLVTYAASDAHGLGPLSVALEGPSGGIASRLVATALETGEVELILPVADMSGLRIAATLEDAAGNAISATSGDFVLDATPPAAPLVTWVTPSPSNALAVEYTVENCELGASVSVGLPSGAPGDTDERWQPCADPVPEPVGAEGPHTLILYMRDAAGNISVAASPHEHVVDRTPPDVSIQAPLPGASIQGGASYQILYMANDLHLETLPIEIAISPDATSDFVATPLEANSGSASANAPLSASAGARVRVRAFDRAGNVGEAMVSFIADVAAPFLSTFSAETDFGDITQYMPPTVLQTPIVRLRFVAADDESDIADYCLKRTQGSNIPTQPTQTDKCWTSFDSPLLEVMRTSDPPTLTLDNYSYRYGFVRTLVYHVFVWVRDRSGRISPNNNMLEVDRLDFVYDPGDPPTLTNVFAMRNDDPVWPLPDDEVTADADDDVIIKWKASFPNNDPETDGTISLYYTEDDVDYSAQIATGLPNSAPSGCTLDVPDVDLNGGTQDFTGCYVWSGGGKPTGYYSVRVVATDQKGISTVVSTVPPINGVSGGSGIKFLAGNSDPGVGGNALSTTFNTRLGIETCHPGLLAVSSRGVVYFLDQDFGLIRVDPNTGNTELLLRLGTEATGDTGPVRDATAKQLHRLYIDYEDRPLLIDDIAVRRIEVDVDGEPTTIDTLLGGGAGTPAPQLDGDPKSFNMNCRYCPIVPLPNGHFYTFVNYQYTAAAFRIVHYKPTGPAPPNDPTGVVDVFAPSGIGFNADGVSRGPGMPYGGFVNQPIESCHFYPMGGVVNIDTGTLEQLVMDVGAHAGESTPCAGVGYGIASLDGQGVAITPLDYPGTPWNYRVTTSCQIFGGLDGEMYWYSADGSPSNGQLIRHNSGGGYSAIVGHSPYTQENCDEGTAALQCKLNTPSAFIDATQAVFWLANGRIRTLDESDENHPVVDLMGQDSSYGDSNDGTPVASLSARFATIDHLSLWKNSTDHLVIMDIGNVRLREADIGGNVRTLAGTGVLNYTGSTNPSTAYGAPVYLRFGDVAAVNSTNGDIHLPWDGLKQGVIRLTRATGNWETVIGGPAAAVPVVSADGVVGSNVDLGYFWRNYIIGPLAEGKLWYMAGGWDGALQWVDHYIKTYTLADSYRQANFAGQPGVVGAPFPADQAPANSHTGSGSVGWIYRGQSVYDAAQSRWIHPRTMALYTHWIVSLPTAGTCNPPSVTTGCVKEIAYPNNEYRAIAFRRTPELPEPGIQSKEVIYYCTYRYYPPPADNRIYAINLTDGVEEPLPWPVPSLRCMGSSMIWDDTRNSLIFAYQRQGGWGVAEYKDPLVPMP